MVRYGSSGANRTISGGGEADKNNWLTMQMENSNSKWGFLLKIEANVLMMIPTGIMRLTCEFFRIFFREIFRLFEFSTF